MNPVSEGKSGENAAISAGPSRKETIAGRSAVTGWKTEARAKVLAAAALKESAEQRGSDGRTGGSHPGAVRGTAGLAKVTARDGA